MTVDNLVRLQKYIADCGIASRRKAEELILHNKVMVNRRTINEMGFKVNPQKDIVTVEGKDIKAETKKVYIMLNKPKGYITTVKDEHDRKTVMELLKEVDKRVYPVGRLDYDTSGLLILTNDGELANKIMHPRFELNKTYEVEVMGTPSNAKLDKLRKGVNIDDFVTSPAKVEVSDMTKNSTTLLMIIHEGKNRQIRKMCDAIGHKVIRLKRISLGEIQLGRLKEGDWRNLTSRELEYLKKL